MKCIFPVIFKTAVGICCGIMLLYATGQAQQKKYYLSASGNDSNDGVTEQSAWRSLQKINATMFRPGDSIFFEGGSTFTGTILLDSYDNGTAEMPVVFINSGAAKAIINAGKGEGIRAINSSHMRFSGLHVRGNGVDRNKGSGIHFYSNDRISAPEDIHITDCDISGFKSYGIVFGCHGNLAVKGYRNVKVTYCNLTENGDGMGSYGSAYGFQHSNFYIAWTKAYRNHGVKSKRKSHSGNGIVMAKIDSLLIEHCEAFENGKDNQSTSGGPVGIWVWMCKNAIIQFCSSHDNYAGKTKDGGGFDIDGGASNCILQYNYSYNNEGAGYLLAEFGALFPFTDNIIRFNISVNDGRKNSYGAITVWGAGKKYPVTNTQVYNNTIYLDDKNVINGTPAAVTFLGPHFKNVTIANNIFATSGRVNFVASDTVVNTLRSILLHNNYYSYTNNYNFKWAKKTYNSLEGWLEVSKEQERLHGVMTTLSVDPLFENRNAIENASKQTIASIMEAISLQGNSALRKDKLALHELFKILPNTKDYCNSELPADGLVIPGACVR